MESTVTTDAPTITPEWVLVGKFCEMTGNTTNAIHQRRKSGCWLDGVHTAVVRRRLYVNIKAADQWIRSQLSNSPQG